jgi:exopolyphosphatase/guanosine-5'-triphosphate,3'-diphosphate pyrophosphatase
MATIASIDVGSNAMRIMIATVTADGSLRPIIRKREAIRLGKEVFAAGRISPQTIRASVAVFRNFRALCERHKVLFVRAVGTSALREAKNSSTFVETIQARTGITIEIISGTEEARLIQLAVSRAVSLKKKLAVVIDMGGGSTEISLIHNGDVIFSETHPIGAVRLLHLLEAKRYTAIRFSKLVREYVQGLQRQLTRHIGSRKVNLCVGTGGNFESLGDLRVKLLGRLQRDRLPLRDLLRILDILNSLTPAERVQKLRLRPDRADVIAPAAAVLAEIMRSAGVHEVRLPGVGLKEGVLLDLLPQVQLTRTRVARQQRIAFAQELGRMYQNDMRHAETVRERAAYLFDKFSQIHKLGSESKLLLEIAALLHDIGHFVNSEDHHKHSMYLIRATPFIGFDRRTQDIVACIARYHRKSLPKQEHEVYQQLSKKDQLTVRKLSALLRIADATDRGRGRVTSVRVRLHRGRYVLSLHGKGELLLEQWSIKKKADLFEAQYKKRLTIALNTPHVRSSLQSRRHQSNKTTDGRGKRR